MTNGVHKLLPVSDLQLDKDNPRVQKWIAMYGDNPSPDQIHQALGHGGEPGTAGTSTTFASLKESIRTTGHIIQPILVNDNGDNLHVIEGNTRLAIYQTFKEDGTEGNWDLIPSIVYDNLDQIEIDAIRLNSHLVGPRQWDPYSKARYLHHLRTTEHMPFDRLVDYCGGRRREVENLIAAYTDMEKYFRPIVEPDDFDTTRFSSFIEIQRNTAKEALLNNDFTLTDFSEWIKKGLFDRQEHIRQLARILPHERARDIFLRDGSNAAVSLLAAEGGETDLGRISLEALCVALGNKLRTLPWAEVQHLKDNPTSELTHNVIDIHAQLQLIIDMLDESEG